MLPKGNYADKNEITLHLLYILVDKFTKRGKNICLVQLKLKNMFLSNFWYNPKHCLGANKEDCRFNFFQSTFFFSKLYY